MVESFLLAWRALVRGHVLTALLALTVLAHVLLPEAVRSDGTAAGGQEMFLRVVPGSVYLLLCVALLACACGLVAQARETHRLALAVVRPVSAGAIVLGPLLALVAVAGIVLALNMGLTCARGGWADCRHVYEPVLEPPEKAAQEEMEKTLQYFKTNENVSAEHRERILAAPRHQLLSIFIGQEIDRYEVIPPGGTLELPFTEEAAAATGETFARIRFSTQFNLRANMSGLVAFGPWSAVVSNSTQSVIDIPLVRAPGQGAGLDPKLVFRNTGSSRVVVRPRRDVQVLTPADSFGMNMLRASGEMLCVITFLCAFGLFLSAALSRPVATFTAFVLLVVAEMAPSVVEQFPETLDITFTERLGLQITRAVACSTSALTKPQPISDLATGTCIEWSALGGTVLVDAVTAPLVLLGLAAYIVRRRVCQP